MRKWTRRAEALFDVANVGRIARGLRPDVIHVHSTNSIVLGHVARLRSLGVPVVVTAHNVTSHEPTYADEAAHRRAFALADLVIAHSEIDRSRLAGAGIDPACVEVIPHGEYGFFGRQADVPDRTAARHRLGLGEDDEVVLFFGYVREYKGLDVLVDAWPEVVRRRPHARLLVVGEADRLEPARRRELEGALRRLGAVTRFGYVPVSEVAPTFAASDVLALPYRALSQSGVLFVALALGVPVVASRVGGLVETLRDGESALLVEPGSAPALADSLVRVLAEPMLRERLVRGGSEVAQGHSWASIAERTERAFERMLDRHRNARGA